MLEFKELNRDNGVFLSEYFLRDNKRRRDTGENIICDRVFGTTFMWRHFYNTKFAMFNDSAVLCISEGSTDMFSVPLGGNIKETLLAVRDYAHSNGIALYFCFVSESDLSCFYDVFDIVFASEERDWFDYLYDKSDITDYAGRKYHGQKNFYNRYKKLNPDCKYVPLNDGNEAEVRIFVRDWFSKYSDGSLMSDAEEKAIYELLDNWEDSGMSGGFITSNNGISGFTVGEVSGDTLYVHIEKADHTLPGAYQFLSAEYLKSITDNNVLFVNREEDMGIEGLRNAKMSLHPVKMLKKYTVYCC